MIHVSRLSGEPFGLNADLIQRVEETPDTVVTLVDGTKLLIGESLAEVIERVVEFRASVLSHIESASPVGRSNEPALRLVADDGNVHGIRPPAPGDEPGADDSRGQS